MKQAFSIGGYKGPSMSHLILTILSIALVGALSVASINYIPFWVQGAAQTEKTVASSLALLEQAYDVATRARDGVPPVVTASPDGGFSEGFLPLLRFMPALPSAYIWSYGVRAEEGEEGTPWAGLNYFCMEPVDPAQVASEAVVRGLERLKGRFSVDQYFVADSCGANENRTMGTTGPATVTFFVAYTPGLSR
jgi:hypothetical protein